MNRPQDAPDLFARTANALSTEQGLKLAIIYGSVATGKMRSDSDLDLAVLFDQSLSAERKMELAARLEQSLMRTVDLVDLSVISGTILKQVLCRGRVLIQNDEGVFTEQLRKMVYNQADMMPYVHRTLMERQRRFLNG